MKDFEKLFNLFVAKDDFRPSLCQPFEQESHIIASDAHKMVWISVSKLNGIVNKYQHQDSPNAMRLIKDCIRNEEFNIDVALLKEQLGKVPLIDEYDKSRVKQCDVCDGEGEHECLECGASHECGACHGDGTVGNAIKTGRQIPDPEKDFILRGVLFKYSILFSLIEASEILEEKKIIQFNHEIARANVFKIGDAEIMLMPKMMCSENHAITINL